MRRRWVILTIGLPLYAVGLMLSGTAALAIMAPRHRLWRKSHCGRCGYSKGPSPAANCPEYGYERGFDGGRSNAGAGKGD